MTNGKPRLSCKFRKIGSISAADLLEMHGIFAKYYENADLETFLKDMGKKHGAFVITELKAAVPRLSATLTTMTANQNTSSDFPLYSENYKTDRRILDFGDDYHALKEDIA